MLIGPFSYKFNPEGGVGEQYQIIEGRIEGCFKVAKNKDINYFDSRTPGYDIAKYYAKVKTPSDADRVYIGSNGKTFMRARSSNGLDMCRFKHVGFYKQIKHPWYLDWEFRWTTSGSAALRPDGIKNCANNYGRMALANSQKMDQIAVGSFYGNLGAWNREVAKYQLYKVHESECDDILEEAQCVSCPKGFVCNGTKDITPDSNYLYTWRTSRAECQDNPGGKCGVCEGDCDRDSHCKSGLKCWQRSSSSSVPPGCKSQESNSLLKKHDFGSHDYCYDPSK